MSADVHPAERDPEVVVLLQIGRTEDGRMLACAYAEWGEDTVVLDTEVVENEGEAHEWYERVSVEKPWIVRH